MNFNRPKATVKTQNIIIMGKETAKMMPEKMITTRLVMMASRPLIKPTPRPNRILKSNIRINKNKIIVPKIKTPFCNRHIAYALSPSI